MSHDPEVDGFVPHTDDDYTPRLPRPRPKPRTLSRVADPDDFDRWADDLLGPIMASMRERDIKRGYR